MKKQKYHYNPSTCSYEAVKRTPWRVFTQFSRYLGGAFALSIGLSWTYVHYTDSPTEVQLRAQNQLLQQAYKNVQAKVTKVEQLLEEIQERDTQLYRTILRAEPLTATVRQAGIGGVDRYQTLRAQSQLAANTQDKLDQLQAKLQVQATSYQALDRLSKQRSRELRCTPAIRPLLNMGRITSGYGIRYHPLFQRNRPHNGIDIAAKIGTPVYATADGVVRRARKGWNGGAGTIVTIEHGYGYHTRYAHLSRLAVQPGQCVIRGQLIAYSGNSGASTGPHLHYEVRKNKRPVNPVNYFLQDVSPSEYQALLRDAAQPTQSMD